ncbi:MAG: YciI family protein [Polyangiaceae bacterium]
MRYMVMHKVDAKMESGGPPDQSIIQAMGELVQGSLKSGVFKNGAGLHRSAQRLRLEFSGGKPKRTPGPYAGSNELVAHCLMVRAATIDLAAELAGRVAAVLGDVEIEVGPVVEPWDIGVIPKPSDPGPARFLLLVKSSAADESGSVDARQSAALSELEQRWSSEGTLLCVEHLAPSSRGARLPPGKKGRSAWTDGPFTESKELVAGFSILELPSKDDVLAWGDRYAAILNVNEVDVREILTP